MSLPERLLFALLGGICKLIGRLLGLGFRATFIASGGTFSAMAQVVLSASAAGAVAWYGALYFRPEMPLWQIACAGLALWWTVVVGTDFARLAILGRPAGSGGSARFARLFEYIGKRYKPGALYLGKTCRSATGFSWALGHRDDRHALVLASSRAGKGSTFIVNNLLRWPAGVIALDPKGELASITARHRPSDAVILDPFGETRGHALCGSYNPLDGLDVESPTIAEEIGLIIDALVVPERGAEHWTESAGVLLSGLIAHVLLTEEGDLRSLASVRDLLTQSEAGLDATLVAMRGHNGPPSVARIAKEAAGLMECDPRQRSGFITTCQRATAFLVSSPMREQTASSTFQMGDLRSRNLSLYIVLPERFITQHFRWMRLLVNQALAAMTADKAPVEHPVLMMLDEFASLRHMRQLETVMGIGAGAGIKVVPVLQNIGQLKAVGYRDPATFLSNAGVIWSASVGDHETAKLLSDQIGKRTRARWERRDRGGHDQGVPLLDPNEIMRFLRREQMRGLVICQGSAPLKIRRQPYYRQHRAIRDYDRPIELRPQGAVA